MTDPSSLPTRDGKPVPHGEEIQKCNTCLRCRLVVVEVPFYPPLNSRPESFCAEKEPPGCGVRNLRSRVSPVSPFRPACDRWSLHPINTYIDRFRDWWWGKRLESDFDYQRERNLEWEAEKRSVIEEEKESRRRGGPHGNAVEPESR